MAKEGKLDWKDTNVGGIGTEEDKSLRKAAASKEPAWDSAGASAGVQVWRIEHFKVIAVDPGTYGQFYKGDSYIVFKTLEGKGGVKTHKIYFYLGTETSVDEQGTAAYKTVELDDYFDGEPTQHREVMGEESSQFKELFESLTYLDGGVDSGFKHVVPDGYDTKMWVVRRVKGKLETIRVPLSTGVLIPGDCFVLDASEAIYVLDGPKSEPLERVAANKKAEDRESERASGVQATHDIDDGFWKLLDGEKPAWLAEPVVAKPAVAAVAAAPEPKEVAKAAAPEPKAVAKVGKDGFFSIEELRNHPCPAGVDPTAKEAHLSDADFAEVFKMSKQDFSKLAKWKQQTAKKNAELF